MMKENQMLYQNQIKVVTQGCFYLQYIAVSHILDVRFHSYAFHLQIIFDNTFKENILKTICNWTKSYFISCIQKRNRPLIFKRVIGLQFVFLITMFVIVWNSCNDSLHLFDWHFTSLKSIFNWHYNTMAYIFPTALNKSVVKPSYPKLWPFDIFLNVADASKYSMLPS
jgi:hypothetical protein